jgi:hypothetical protein
LTATVLDGSGNPVPGYPLQLEGFVEEESGGHDHTEARPTGFFLVNGAKGKRCGGTTGKDGTLKVDYLCGGFGGVDSIFGKGLTKDDTATAAILVRMGDFKELEKGDNYVLIGQYGLPGVTSQHIQNHFGTESLVRAIKALAKSIYSKKKYKLRYNDMSIRSGGPFDIGNDWNVPHQNHRAGKSIDIDDSTLSSNGKLIRISEEKMVEWLKAVVSEYSIKDEGDHYHVTIFKEGIAR